MGGKEDYVRKTTPINISLWELCQNPNVLERENFKMITYPLLAFWCFFCSQTIGFWQSSHSKCQGVLFSLHDLGKTVAKQLKKARTSQLPIVLYLLCGTISHSWENPTLYKRTYFQNVLIFITDVCSFPITDSIVLEMLGNGRLSQIEVL